LNLPMSWCFHPFIYFGFYLDFEFIYVYVHRMFCNDHTLCFMCFFDCVMNHKTNSNL
jgi:hypothetical protein